MSDPCGQPSLRCPTDGEEAVNFYRRILDGLADGVYFVDSERRINYWNRGAELISGYAAGEVVGRCCRDNLLVHTDFQGTNLCLEGCPLLATLRDGRQREIDVFLKHKAGHRVPVSVRVSPIQDSTGRVVGAVEIFSENSSKLAALERATELQSLALIDPLTGAGNRRYAEKLLHDHAERFQRSGDVFAILFFDLDHFKRVNDGHGHNAGDAVLQAVARTIMTNIRSFDFLGRWGGDEFIVILSDSDSDKARITAARCCALVRSCSIDSKDERIQPTISAGIAVVRPNESLEDLISRADKRLYLAKTSGRDRYMG